MEEHDGKISDPRGHEDKVDQAAATLSNFARQMDEGRVPQCTLEQVYEAVETLGHFAGYPSDAHHLELYLESESAHSSYTQVARLVGPFASDMVKRIQQRITILNSPGAESKTDATAKDREDDVPF
jgi:hypothetical protein